MEIQLFNNEVTGTGHFRALEEKKQIGLITYFMNGRTMVVDHTEVNPERRNKGIGEDLVEAVVIHARKTGMKVDPRCPFAKATINRNSSWKDVVVN